MQPDHPGGLLMGRTFESLRMGAKDVSARWLKAGQALKKEDQVYAQKLAEMIIFIENVVERSRAAKAFSSCI
jgi:hypothetical protein